MKEPHKEVPVELERDLEAFEKLGLSHHPTADAIRDLIEDWKRLKEEQEENNSELQQRLDRVEKIIYDDSYGGGEAIALLRDILDE